MIFLSGRTKTNKIFLQGLHTSVQPKHISEAKGLGLKSVSGNKDGGSTVHEVQLAMPGMFGSKDISEQVTWAMNDIFRVL